jgi:hypothetical protein
VKAISRRPAVLLGIALAAVVVVGLAAILIGTAAHHDRDGDARGPSTVTGPRDGARTATFELLDGATLVRVRAGALGDDLFRVTVPDGGGLTPKIDRDHDDVRLRLAPDGDGGSGEVDVVVNADVAWALRTVGGAQDLRIDMTGGHTDSIEFAGGASRIEVALAKPAGPTPVTMTGGVDQFAVTLPAGTPVRVAAASGAGQVTLDGQTHQGVGGGQVFTAGGWQDGGAGVDVQARAGAGGITITEG